MSHNQHISQPPKNEIAHFLLIRLWNQILLSFIFHLLVYSFNPPVFMGNPLCTSLSACHQFAGMSETLEIACIQFTECAVLEMTFRIQSCNLLFNIHRHLFFSLSAGYLPRLFAYYGSHFSMITSMILKSFNCYSSPSSRRVN